MDKKFEHYPKTELFQVIDSIGVPHPYCITPKHVAWASDHCNGMLGAEAIKQAESHGAKCDICKKIVKKDRNARILSYEEHEQALLIEVNSDKELKDIPELKPYLLSIKALTEKERYAGFAFKKRSSNG